MIFLFIIYNIYFVILYQERFSDRKNQHPSSVRFKKLCLSTIQTIRYTVLRNKATTVNKKLFCCLSLLSAISKYGQMFLDRLR